MRTKKLNAEGNKAVNALIYILFTIFTLLCIYPFYYLIINTISANDISANGDIMFLPSQIHFQNYIDVLKIPGLLQATWISAARTVIGTVGTVFTAAFLGFMFTQEKMWGRKFWYRYIVATMYFSAGLIPWYITMMNLRLTNNFLGYILPALVQPFNIILVKTFIESTPKALQEAAEIDGAGTLRVFGKIILPISKPILATVAIFAAVGQWNSFQDTLVLVTDQSLYSLQYVLYQYINQSSSLASLIKSSQASGATIQSLTTMQTPTSVRMTVSVIVVIPIMLVYPL